MSVTVPDHHVRERHRGKERCLGNRRRPPESRHLPQSAHVVVNEPTDFIPGMADDIVKDEQRRRNPPPMRRDERAFLIEVPQDMDNYIDIRAAIHPTEFPHPGDLFQHPIRVEQFDPRDHLAAVILPQVAESSVLFA